LPGHRVVRADIVSELLSQLRSCGCGRLLRTAAQPI
jgi:hypothetical protein